MSVVDANELTDRITLRLACMGRRQRRRRFLVVLLCLVGLLLTMLIAAALIWILTA